MRAFRVDDRVYAPPVEPSAVQRALLGLLVDPRDLPFLPLIAACSLVVLPAAAALYVPGVFRWWLGVAYVLVVVLGFLGPFTLMLHHVSHRPLFKHRWMNAWVPWVLGPFFGESPETYFVHHVGMHHPENNLAGDLSCTLRYRRDSARAFARYFVRFFFGVMVEMTLYLVRRRRFSLLRRMLAGELGFYAAVIALFAWQPGPTVAVFIVPFVICRFGLMVGGWAQHAFVDPLAPENLFRSGINCINTKPNREWFNDGYHIGHHLKPTQHWTEAPGDFEAQRARYAEERAIVFDGIDFLQVWWFLMRSDFERLAEHFVVLGEITPTRDAVVALLRERTLPLPGRGEGRGEGESANAQTAR